MASEFMKAVREMKQEYKKRNGKGVKVSPEARAHSKLKDKRVKKNKKGKCK